MCFAFSAERLPPMSSILGVRLIRRGRPRRARHVLRGRGCRGPSGDMTGRLTGNQAATLALLAFAMLIVSLDQYIVVVALPDIGRELGYSAQTLQSVISAYAVTSAGFLLLGGRAADLLGRRRVFVSGPRALRPRLPRRRARADPGRSCSSPAPRRDSAERSCSPPPSPWSTPHSPKAPRATGRWRSGAVRGRRARARRAARRCAHPGVRLGSGVLRQHAAGRRGGAAGVPADPRRRRPETKRHFDLPGAFSAALGVTLLVFALVEGPNLGWASPAIVASAAVSLLLLGALTVIERHSPDPLVPPRLLANRNLSTAVVIAFLFWATFGSVLYFLTIYFQDVHGYDALQTGVGFLLPTTVVVVPRRSPVGWRPASV